MTRARHHRACASSASRSLRWCAAFALALFVPATTCNAAPATPPGLDPAKAITQYVHDSWSTRDGLPNRRVSAIVQTRDGYLWIGTGAGLARFDGVRFAVFNSRTHPEIGNDDIRTLPIHR